jgi:hypothetical protein
MRAPVLSAPERTCPTASTSTTAPATVDSVCTNGKYSAMYFCARSRDCR